MTEKERLDSLDERVEQLREQVEELTNSLGDKSTQWTHKVHIRPARYGRDSLFWGLVLLIAGGIMIIDKFTVFDIDLPLLPSALIVVGLYIIIRGRYSSR